MTIPSHINDELLKFLNNFTVDEYIITAGIADYFNFKEQGISTNIVVGDIDIYVQDISVIKKMESIFNVSAIKKIEFNENPLCFSNGYSGKSRIAQYLFPGTCYDVYLLEKKRYESLEVNDTEYQNSIIRYCLLSNTYLQTVNAFNFNYNKYGSQTDKLLKYLKKIIICKGINK